MKKKDVKNRDANDELLEEDSTLSNQNDLDKDIMADDDAENSNDTEANESTNDEVENLKEQCDELRDKNLRLMAEFDNYRKRTLNEKSNLIKTASEKVFVDTLPLLDDFERALQAIETTDDIKSVKEGVELIYNKFLSFLNSNGVKEIPTVGEAFDMELHDAVTMYPTDDDDSKGKIIDCLLKGYTLNDKVIRFPKVVVGE